MRIAPPVIMQFVIFCAFLSGRSVQAQDESATFTDSEDTTLDSALSNDEATLPPAPSETPVTPADALPTPPPPPANEPVVAAPPAAADVVTPEEATTDETAAEDQGASDEETTAEQSEEQQQGEAVEAATVETPKADIAVAPQEETSQSDARNVRIYGSRLFGRQRIQVAGNQPRFTEYKELREKLYGKEKMYPTLTGDWFPLDWWVNPGLSMRVGGYSVTGKSVRGTPTQDQLDSGNVTIDETSKTTFLIIPLMVGAKIEMTPFRGKWLVLDGWAGYEYAWWQETGTTATSSSIRSPLYSMAEPEPVRTTKGTQSAMVMGASANFLLNWLDERTVRSMVDTMGISSVYVSPFVETVKSFKKDGLTFSRNTIGVGFTFESAN